MAIDNSREDFDVFSFKNSSDALGGFVDFKKAISRYFSISNWCKKLEIRSSGTLVNIIKRRRLIPPNLVPKLLDSMELDADSRLYFLLLTELERAKQGHNDIAVQLLKSKIAVLRSKCKNEISGVDQARMLTLKLHVDEAQLSQVISEIDSFFNALSARFGAEAGTGKEYSLNLDFVPLTRSNS